MAVAILFRRLFTPASAGQSNFCALPHPVNRALAALFSAERIFLRRLRFPYVGSIFCLAEKDQTEGQDHA